MKKLCTSIALAAAALCILFGGCGKHQTEAPAADGNGAAVTDTADKAPYDSILSAEHLALEDACAKIRDIPPANDAQELLAKKLSDLKNCSGPFVQTSAETGNRYNAKASFYLAAGKIMCAVTYDGYLGEIGEAEIKDAKTEGFLFEAQPKGDLFGNEQDFHIYFAPDRLRIAWADTCDYTLTRGDGSADGVQSAKTPYEESNAFKTVVSTLDEKYADYKHSVVYDPNEMAVTMFIQAPESTSTMLKAANSDVLTAWNNLVDSMKSINSGLTPVVKLGGEAYYFNLIMVNRLDSGNQYTEEDYVLWIQNGEVKYDYAKAHSSGGAAPATTTPASTTPATTRSAPATTAPDTRNASYGDLNALQTAKDYLATMAFSYSGLIEQLKYEGYSTSEATYAADHCGADWYQQAEKMAREYLDTMSFSRSGLIEQLEYEGFTSDQATSAVNNVYR